MGPRLKLQIVTIVLCVVLATIAPAAEPDAVLQARLVGTWYETRKVDCESNKLNIALNRDGTFEVKGEIEGCGRKFNLTWRGKWGVKAGRFHYTTTYSEPAEEYPIGSTFSDQILSVTDTEWVMLEESTGNKSIAKRVMRL